MEMTIGEMRAKLREIAATPVTVEPTHGLSASEAIDRGKVVDAIGELDRRQRFLAEIALVLL